MLSVNKLKQKIGKLETERDNLKDEIKKLKLEADGKALMLEREVEDLAEEAEALRQLITAS
ncbi:hypothetical protein MUO71_02750 [Candidatus Bathyarchaeota archaeon]|nr:hypothetical protein [Candidatus Bathyarchaeota archaeon]